MLANYVGEGLFLKGVSLYLKDHLYANTVTDDLWKGIGKATGNLVLAFFVPMTGHKVWTSRI